MAEDAWVERVPVEQLKPHPRNYQQHPEEQLEHLAVRIQKYGFYRNVVVAQDGTILAGHGIVQAAKRIGMQDVPVHRLELEPDEPRALAVLAGDNEVTRLALRDDRALSEMLKEINDSDDEDLEGTGFDPAMLANLVMVTRSQSEIQDFDAAAHWVGLPGYEPGDYPTEGDRIVVHFASPEDRADFCEKLDLELSTKAPSTWYPQRERDDVKSLMFEA